ncbi:MAG: hypothetical protein LKM44_03130 [Wolbachia endosymbiont of Meromenopon meropis]|nr:hypothetical protein [Wolbachia endosymbiont of Meromenopon meropis]
MSFGYISIYSVVLLVGIKIFLLCGKLSKKFVKKVIFFKKIRKKGWNKSGKYNEHYRTNEQKEKELIKHQEIPHKKLEDVQFYEVNPEIINIAKPLGRWTKMVMMGNGLMKRLSQLIHEEGRKKGFWELFVKAQASTKGKYRGKAR